MDMGYAVYSVKENIMINLTKKPRPNTSHLVSLLQLGDLFFNTDNLEVNSLFDRAQDGYPSQSDISNAVMEDAIAFSANIGQESNHELIDWLVEHYLERI